MALGLAIFTALGFTVVISAARARRRLKSYQAAADGYIQTIFADQSFLPEAKVEFVYGIPAFALRFRTDEEKNRAASAGLTRRFVENIQQLCGHLKPRGEDFNAERAVAVFSQEDEQRWKEQAASFRARHK